MPLKPYHKAFMVALLAMHGSHRGNRTLVSQSKRPYFTSVLILFWPRWPSQVCHLADSESKSKYKIKAENVLLWTLSKS